MPPVSQSAQASFELELLTPPVDLLTPKIVEPQGPKRATNCENVKIEQDPAGFEHAEVIVRS